MDASGSASPCIRCLRFRGNMNKNNKSQSDCNDQQTRQCLDWLLSSRVVGKTMRSFVYGHVSYERSRTLIERQTTTRFTSHFHALSGVDTLSWLRVVFFFVHDRHFERGRQILLEFKYRLSWTWELVRICGCVAVRNTVDTTKSGNFKFQFIITKFGMQYFEKATFL